MTDELHTNSDEVERDDAVAAKADVPAAEPEAQAAAEPKADAPMAEPESKADAPESESAPKAAAPAAEPTPAAPASEPELKAGAPATEPEPKPESTLFGQSIFTWFFAIKFLAAVIFALLACTRQKSPFYLVFCLLEIALVAGISNHVAKRNSIAGSIVSAIGLALVDIQIALLLFSNSYFSYQMYANLMYAADVGGGAAGFAVAAVIIVITCLLPIRGVKLPISDAALTIAVLALELLATFAAGNRFSPLYGYAILSQEVQASSMRSQLALQAEGDYARFFKEEVAGGIERPKSLPEQPNVILIFTEGLSQHIVDDERQLMPNVASYQEKSLNFTNYYNHTAATENGLTGQLFSGYLHPNSLLSLPMVLGVEGYHTTFINTEPDNEPFSDILSRLGFQEVIGEGAVPLDGPAKSMTDKAAYEYLFDTALELNEGDQPFFLSIYTFGTHAYVDSADEVFGDGTNPELNKFYAADVWFGEFMRKFEQSELYDNTVVIFTADHATYNDQAFKDSFPTYDYPGYFIDRMPLFFYHKGVDARNLDAGARNSLCMTPTLLDYLDISVPNYFLGDSLFAYREVGNRLEHYFFDGGFGYQTTEGGTVRPLSDEEVAWFQEQLLAYDAIRLSGDAKWDEGVLKAQGEADDSAADEDAASEDGGSASEAVAEEDVTDDMEAEGSEAA